MDPHTTFAKTCAEQIMCTRHIPGVRAEIEKAIMTFDEKIRPRIIQLVKQEIARIKSDRNIDGATVIMVTQPKTKTPRIITAPVKVFTNSDDSDDSDGSDSSSVSTATIGNENTDNYRIISGRDLGCTQEEEVIYDSLIK